MKPLFTYVFGACTIVAPAVAQQPIIATLPAMTSVAEPAFLPANTEVLLRVNDALNGKSVKEGDSFRLTVAQDVLLNGYVVIPRGTPASGEVTWGTGKGMFGKSGKMEVALRYIEYAGQRIPVEGKFRQEGEGSTVATVGSVLFLLPAAPFITGKSALIPAGRELMAHTRDQLPVSLPVGAAPTAIVAVAAAPVRVTAGAPPVPTSPALPASAAPPARR